MCTLPFPFSYLQFLMNRLKKTVFIGENYYSMKFYTSAVHSAYSPLILLAFHSLTPGWLHHPHSSLNPGLALRKHLKVTVDSSPEPSTSPGTQEPRAPPGPMCLAQSCTSAGTDCSGHVMLQRWHFAVDSVLPSLHSFSSLTQNILRASEGVVEMFWL